MFGTSGSPVYWYAVNYTDIRSVGLLDDSGMLLSMERLFALEREDISYAQWQEVLGVVGPQYQFFISAHTLSEEEVLFVGNTSEDAQHVSVREAVVYNGTDALVLRLGVWV